MVRHKCNYLLSTVVSGKKKKITFIVVHPIYTTVLATHISGSCMADTKTYPYPRQIEIENNFLHH